MDRLEKQPTELRRKACLFRGQDTILLRPQKVLEAETSEAVLCLSRTCAPRIRQFFVDRRRRTPRAALFKDLSGVEPRAEIPKLISSIAFSRKHVVVACQGFIRLPELLQAFAFLINSALFPFDRYLLARNQGVECFCCLLVEL
jgi:hypothetical protein